MLPQVQIELNNEGTKEFAQLTEKNVGKRLAIIFNDEVVAIPVINEPILHGKMVIQGNFSINEAKKIANYLKLVIKRKVKK